MEPLEKFWLNDPKILFITSGHFPTIIPTKEMTVVERLNTLTRLLIIIVIVLYFLDYNLSDLLIIFTLGIILILALKSSYKSVEHFGPHRGGHPACEGCGFDSTQPHINFKYEISPQNQYTHLNDGIRSYANAKYKLIPPYVPAPFNEVWRREPKFCNEFNMNPDPYNIVSPSATTYKKFQQPQPKCFFEDTMYRDVLPSSQCGYSRVSAMPAVQSAFIRDSSEFRNNIMGQYIDTFAKQRQHGCARIAPGRASWT